MIASFAEFTEYFKSLERALDNGTDEVPEFLPSELAFHAAILPSVPLFEDDGRLSLPMNVRFVYYMVSDQL
jgi:hypothetical protein